MSALLEKGMDSEGYAGFSTRCPALSTTWPTGHTRKQIPDPVPRRSAELKHPDQHRAPLGPRMAGDSTEDSPLDAAHLSCSAAAGSTATPEAQDHAVARIDLHTIISLAKLGIGAVAPAQLEAGRAALFRFQALSAPFKLWSDGVITPIAEEIPELRVLNEMRAGRAARAPAHPRRSRIRACLPRHVAQGQARLQPG